MSELSEGKTPKEEERVLQVIITKTYRDTGDSVTIAVKGNVEEQPNQQEIYGIIVSGFESMFHQNLLAMMQKGPRIVQPTADDIGSLGISAGREK